MEKSLYRDMSMFSNNNDNNVLTIKTVQIAPFRTLMTALKDILLETNITFQKDGIRIINMDKSHTILAHLFLRAENFELYECKQEKIIIGVNFISEQILSDNEEDIVKNKDTWVFEKPVNSNGPAWTLIST